MKKFAWATALLLCFSLPLIGCTGSESPKKGNDKATSLSAGIQLDPGWEKIQQEERNLYGDKAIADIKTASLRELHSTGLSC